MTQDSRNILYVETGTFGGGSFESLYVLLKHMDRARLRPVVLFLNDTKYVNRVRELGIPCYMVKDRLCTIKDNAFLKAARGLNLVLNSYVVFLSLLWEYLIHWSTMKETSEIIRRHEIDLIHSNDHINRDFFCTYLAQRHGLKLVSHLRTFTGDGFNRFKGRHANKIVNRYIVISKSVQAFWERKGLDAGKMVMIYNGIERPSVFPVNIRRQLGVEAQRTRILGAVGTYNRQRGYEFLLRGFSLLRARGREYRLLIIGDGNGKNLAGLVHSLGLEPYVHFMEHVDRAVDYIAEMDCLIIPYEVEPFGRVLLEAWMLKTPVVMTDADFIRDVVDEGKNCVLVKYGDVEGLAEKVEDLVEDERRVKEMVEQSYRHVHERYGVDRYVEAVQRVYEELAP